MSADSGRQERRDGVVVIRVRKPHRPNKSVRSERWQRYLRTAHVVEEVKTRYEPDYWLEERADS